MTHNFEACAGKNQRRTENFVVKNGFAPSSARDYALTA